MVRARTDPATWPDWYLLAVLRAMCELRAQRFSDEQLLIFWRAYAAGAP